MGLISRVSSRTYRRTMAALQTYKHLYQYLTAEYKKHAKTSNLDSKHLKAAEQDAINYVQMLESNRKHRELLNEYHLKGERSVKDAAELVGLKVPDAPF